MVSWTVWTVSCTVSWTVSWTVTRHLHSSRTSTSASIRRRPRSPPVPQVCPPAPWPNRAQAGACEDREVGGASVPPPEEDAVAEQIFATLHTNRGDIRIQLLPDHAPKTVRNFVELA